MENATRFMYMAVGVIIGVFILGIFAYVFRAGAEYNKNYDIKKSREQLEFTNSLLEAYNIQGLTISDIVSVCNLAYSVNEECQYDETQTVNIVVKGISGGNISISNTDKGLKRNQVLRGNNPIYIYDLLEKTEYSGLGDKLSITKYDRTKNKTIYRYTFDCTKIEYHQTSGKVATMEFTMKILAPEIWDNVQS